MGHYSALRNPKCGQYGPPRFLGQSFDARRPQPPRRAQWLHIPIASPLALRFVPIGGLATLKEINEAESGSLALRLTSSPSEAPILGSLPHRSVGYMCKWVTHMVNTSQFTRLGRLSLAHQLH